MTPLLFLHGVGGGHHAWERQLPFFAGRGYASHAWDQPGYGHSPTVEPYDLEQVCASLRRLIEAETGQMNNGLACVVPCLPLINLASGYLVLNSELERLNKIANATKI